MMCYASQHLPWFECSLSVSPEGSCVGSLPFSVPVLEGGETFKVWAEGKELSLRLLPLTVTDAVSLLVNSHERAVRKEHVEPLNGSPLSSLPSPARSTMR